LKASVVIVPYQLDLFALEEIGHARHIMERYADLRIGLADASVVVLANRHRILDLLCTDERHFRALRGALSAGPFVCSRSTSDMRSPRLKAHTSRLRTSQLHSRHLAI